MREALKEVAENKVPDRSGDLLRYAAELMRDPRLSFYEAQSIAMVALDLGRVRAAALELEKNN